MSLGHRGRYTILCLTIACAVAPSACETGQRVATLTGPGSGATGGAPNGSGGDLFGGSPPCAPGELCEGGVCIGDECCPAEKACDTSCCADGDVCSFKNCVTPGNICYEASDCPDGWYCEYALGDPTMTGTGGGDCVSGVEPPNGKCLPEPPICGENQDPGEPPSCLEECKWEPQPGNFFPVLKYSWGGTITPPYDTDVMMMPIVIQLDDDDCDGKITERDIPEIVFTSFASGNYSYNGTLHVISIVDYQLVHKLAVPNAVVPITQIAGGNIDGQPGNEIVGCGSDYTVKAFNAQGNVLWTSPSMFCFMPSIADLDQDGSVEVVVEGGILDGATGQIEHGFSAPLASSFVLSDITGDGKLDVVTASQGYDQNGQLFVDTGQANTSAFGGSPDWKSPFPAVADLDHDGTAEVLAVHNLSHTLRIWRYDATAPGSFVMVRGPIDINGTLSTSLCSGLWGETYGGGPPTVADFNGDGTPDVALAGGVGYAVFDGSLLMNPAIAGPDTFLWVADTKDCSSTTTASTLFDFEGDGKAEVVYSDEEKLRVYDGETGYIKWETCNTNGTVLEGPIVADVDNDGHADIVAVSNAYASPFGWTCNSTAQAGLRIWGDGSGSWVRTRRVWNQHAYHITNVEESGAIPTVEATNYLEPGLNNFRLNKQPGGEFSAPDAIVSIAPICSAQYALGATVRNVGEAALPSGVVVGFYAGSPPDGMLLGKETTTRTLYQLESELVVLPLNNASSDIKSGATPIYAVVDDTTDPHPSWTECRTDNNTSAPASGSCAQPD